MRPGGGGVVDEWRGGEKTDQNVFGMCSIQNGSLSSKYRTNPFGIPIGCRFATLVYIVQYQILMFSYLLQALGNMQAKGLWFIREDPFKLHLHLSYFDARLIQIYDKDEPELKGVPFSNLTRISNADSNEHK